MSQPTRTSELWMELSEEQQEFVSGGLDLDFPRMSLDFPSFFGLGDRSQGDDFWSDDSEGGCVRKERPMEDGRNVEIICNRQTEKHI